MKLFFIAPYCFGLETSLLNGLKDAGVDVDSFIYGVHNDDKGAIAKRIYNHYGLVRLAKKGLARLGLLNPFLERPLRKMNDSLLARIDAFKPDVVFIVKGEVLFPETLRRLGERYRLVSYHWDDPFLGYAQQVDGTGDVRYKNIFASYGFYDLTFVYDESYIPRLSEHGARRSLYLMDWFEPEIYKTLSLSDAEKAKWGSDVAFVGSPYPNRLELLDALKDFDVGVWGPEFRWREHFVRYPALKKQYRGEAPGADAVKVYNASKIALNIHDSFQCFSSVNNRTFQILASGAFELVDEREKLHALFDVGKDLDTYRSYGEAAEKVRHYLDHPEEREAARKRGHEKARGHSSLERARFMLDEIRRLPAARGS